MHEYDILIRSRRTSGLHGIGAHLFHRPLVEGEHVHFEGAVWKVVEVQVDRTPRAAVLELETSAPQGTSPQGRGQAPHIGRA